MSKSLEALKLMTESLQQLSLVIHDCGVSLETVKSALEDYEHLCRELNLLAEEDDDEEDDEEDESQRTCRVCGTPFLVSDENPKLFSVAMCDACRSSG